jgi:site-specific DNA recombinase
VTAFYKEDHSAKTFDQPEFKKLLAFLKSNKHSADLLLFLKWDRFSPNAADDYGMISQLNKLGVEPQAVEQPLDMNIPEHKFMLTIYLAAPEVENDRRSLNISDGIHKSMKEGLWMGPAPVGYKRSRDENNKACIIPSDKSPIVQWAFEEMATGLHHIDHLRMLAHRKGLKIKRSAFYDMFRNPSYIGKIRVPVYKVDPAMIVEAKHEPIIATKLFNDVQDIWKEKEKEQPACKAFPKRRTAPAWIFYLSRM